MNLKLHPTMIILSLRTQILNFLTHLLKKILTILKDLNGIDNMPGQFLKDGTDILARPISQLCNFSIKLSSFPRSCKIAKVKRVQN